MRNTPVFQAEFHDVGAENAAAVVDILQQLAEAGWPRWALMVVPDATEVAMQTRVEFQQFLRAWRVQGHGLFAHGFRHRADAGLRRSWLGEQILALTGNEAEFAGLGRSDSLALLERARLAWEALEVGAAEGFVAPTWHANVYLKSQCRRIGWRFFGSRWFVHDLSDNTRRFSPAFSFAGLPEWSLDFVRLCARVYAWLGRHLPLPSARLVLHPSDLKPEQRGATLALLRSLARGNIL